MVTGASNCDLSIIIVNIKNGVTDQTKRHLYVCKLLQIKNIILIVNKMDLIDFNQTKFNEVVKKSLISQKILILISLILFQHLLFMETI